MDDDGITISHGPVPALKWPAMTMSFGKADLMTLTGLKPGDLVRFEFRKGGPLDWEVVSVQKSGSDAGTTGGAK
jgi:Cu(I)/Ag(I) efflux system membrane fusion protein